MSVEDKNLNGLYQYEIKCKLGEEAIIELGIKVWIDIK